MKCFSSSLEIYLLKLITGYKSQAGEGNVDEQIDAAALLCEDANGRQDEGKDDLANVTAGEWHFGDFLDWLVSV